MLFMRDVAKVDSEAKSRIDKSRIVKRRKGVSG